MSLDRRHTILVNPSACGGKTRKLLPAVERALADHGIEYGVVTTEGLEHGCAEALAAAGRGEVPVVMSGDGLIGAVGGALAGTGHSLGVIPGGRGNDLARVLGIPDTPEGAADVLAAGRLREIDVGEANGRRFLCIASAGFDSDANRIANESRIRGSLVYAYAAIRALAAWRPAEFTIVADGEKASFSGYAVAVANSKAYGGGMFVAPDAELDDGRFDVVMTGRVSKLRFLANLPKVFKGTHVGNPEIRVIRAARVELSADRPFALYADGEHLTDLPVTMTVLHRALRVIAPSAG